VIEGGESCHTGTAGTTGGNGGQTTTTDTLAALAAPLTTSAPGKVLITGGYLILEKPHQGLVVSTTARFHTTVQWRRAAAAGSAAAAAAAAPAVFVVVRSPQFGNATCYAVTTPASQSPVLARVEAVPFVEHGKLFAPAAHNPYVHTTLRYCFTALHVLGLLDAATLLGRKLQGGYLDVVLNADNCFYSQQGEFANRGLRPSEEAYGELPAFMKPQKISKTGLGSSATLVTSLVGALMAYLGGMHVPRGNRERKAPSPSDKASVQTIHRLAQLCHVVAQGKVGSGFDVSAAVFGSISYERYSPALLSRFIGNGQAPPTCDDIAAVVGAHSSVDAWDHGAEPFGLPDGLEIVLGDIAQGSSTPSMVRRVKAWRKNNAGSDALWFALRNANEVVKAGLSALREQGNRRAVETRDQICKDFLEVRKLLKRMGTGAGVGIEPGAQTSLCDATMGLDGVLMCGVPGAGGNDAVFAIYCGGDSTRRQIEAFWDEWRGTHDIKLCAMPLRGTPHGDPGLRIDKD
jgi:phosphomevalonate kinase